MDLKYINVDNINIAYREVNPDGEKSIFFFHGNSSSHRSWEKQMESPALSRFRLIAFDLPGHGGSQSYNNPEMGYRLTESGKTMAKVVTLLSDERKVYLAGFSYGSNIVAEILGNKNDIAGIILLSPSIAGGTITPDKIFKPSKGEIFFSDLADLNSITDFFTEEVKTDRRNIEVLVEDYLATNNRFRSSLIQGVINGFYSDEIKSISGLLNSVLVIFGKDDSLLNTTYLDNSGLHFWGDGVYQIEGCGHYTHLENSDLINKLLSAYLLFT